ncbi:DUF2073 domain-containing protein [Candidatus Woesearchaeota archaeon]|nr:DUF2073 domain-containing protein [Candidatus Woesearchaeota archaeon]
MALTIQFVPYAEIEHLGSARRVNKLLDLARQNKIVVLQGRLKKEEETDLIAITMEKINDSFKGIELAVIQPQAKSETLFDTVKAGVINVLLGDRAGLTVIGPATIVKQIKKDPDKIELLTKELVKRSRKKL